MLANKEPCRTCGKRLALHRTYYCSKHCAYIETYRRRRGHRPRSRAEYLAHVAHQDPPLKPWMREYLRAFDRALRERTSEAWGAMHRLAPASSGRAQHEDRELAAACRLLEAV